MRSCVCVRACMIARSSRSSALVESTILFLDAYITELQQSEVLFSTLQILAIISTLSL